MPKALVTVLLVVLAGLAVGVAVGWFVLSALADRASFEAHSGDSPAHSRHGSANEQKRGPVAPPARTYTKAELLNTSLEVAPTCYTFVAREDLDLPKSGVLEFVDGEAASPTDQYAKVYLKEAKAVQLGGRNLTALHLECFGGGAYAYDSVQFIDEDKNLVTYLETWGRQEHYLDGFFMYDHVITSFSVDNDKLSVGVKSIGLIGDGDAHADGRSGEAHLTVRWDGKEFVDDELYISTPNGDVTAPDLAKIQAFYKALAEGRDAQAAPHTTAENMHAVAHGCLGVCDDGVSNYRKWVFPKDGYVEHCFLAGPDNSAYFSKDGDIRQFGSLSYWTDPGDYVCGLIYGRQLSQVTDTHDMQYPAWLVVKSPRGGDFFVTEFGRSFS